MTSRSFKDTPEQTFECSLLNVPLRANELTAVELERCALLGDRNYTLYAYVEDFNIVTNFFGGTLSEGTEIYVPHANKIAGLQQTATPTPITVSYDGYHTAGDAKLPHGCRLSS